MLTMHREMLALLTCHRMAGGDETTRDELFRKIAGPVVLPDAIRAFGVPRQASHFESGPEGASWMRYPSDTRAMTRESVKALTDDPARCHVAPHGPATLGDPTDVATFRAFNRDLPAAEAAGLEASLDQDVVFDRWVRDFADTTVGGNSLDKERDGFTLSDGRGGVQCDDPKRVRAWIGDIEQQAMADCARRVYEETGVTCDDAWARDVVRPALEETLPKEMADSAASYMAFAPGVGELVSHHDFAGASVGPLAQDHLDRLHARFEGRMLDKLVARDLDGSMASSPHQGVTPSSEKAPYEPPTMTVVESRDNAGPDL